MEIVNDNHLVIANGRKLGDSNGAITCIQNNGCSVVDHYTNYFLETACMISYLILKSTISLTYQIIAEYHVP